MTLLTLFSSKLLMNHLDLRTFSIGKEAEAVRDSTFGTISSGTLFMNCRLGAEKRTADGSSLALPAHSNVPFTPVLSFDNADLRSLIISERPNLIVILTRVFVQTAREWALQHAGLIRLHFPQYLGLIFLF